MAPSRLFSDPARWTDDSQAFPFELLGKAGVGVANGMDSGRAGKGSADLHRHGRRFPGRIEGKAV